MVLLNGDPRDPAGSVRREDPEKDPSYPDNIIVHPDARLPRGAFIHGLPITFSVIEEADGDIDRVGKERVRLSDREPDRRQGVGEQGTSRPRSLPGEARRILRRAGRCAHHGTGTRTVHPRIVNLRTHRGFGFDGVVPDGLELVFATDGRAFLDGTEVTGRCHVYKGALFGGSPFDASAKPHVFPVSVPSTRSSATFRVRPRHPPRSSRRCGSSLAKPIGSSTSRRERSTPPPSTAACSRFPPTGPARNALPPSGKVELMWREHEPFTVRLLIPSSLQTLETMLLDGESLRTLVRAGLERFRAAGIRLTVDWFDDKWVLDESVIRDHAVEAGLGVTFDDTVPARAPTG